MDGELTMLFNADRRRNRDRRGAPRSVATGGVRVWFEDPARVTVDAEWIESSATGFRLAHDSAALEPGLEVNYEADGQRGRARVAWTHVCEGRRVSGFLIV